MTEKQKIFADEYLIDLNATRAYRKAYPSVKKEEFYYGIFSERSRNFTDICDRTGSRYWNLEFNQGKGGKEIQA